MFERKAIKKKPVNQSVFIMPSIGKEQNTYSLGSGCDVTIWIKLHDLYLFHPHSSPGFKGYIMNINLM